MAYRTDSLGKVLDQIDESMIRLKQNSQAANAAMAAGNVDADYIINLRNRLNRDKASFQSWAATPGLAAYARNEKNDENYNIATEFTAVIAAMTAVVNSIESTFPKDGSGYLLARQFSGTTIAVREFTPAQTTALRGLITTLIASID